MKRLFSPIRIAVVLIGMFAVLAVYVIALYDMQVINGEVYLSFAENHQEVGRRVLATRGRIMDRYEVDLVSNRAVNNIVIDWVTLGNSPRNNNETILELAELTRSMGHVHTDTLPITASPFTFTEMTATQAWHLNRYIRHHERGIRNMIRDMSVPEFETEEDDYEAPAAIPANEELSIENVTAVQIMAFMRQQYRISPELTAEETRTLAGIRFELDLRNIIGMDEYLFVQDASVELISTILERDFPGVRVQPNSLRRYNTTVAAHILGRVGPMTEEDVDRFPDYPPDARIGIDGLERDFEEFLHGANGRMVQTLTSAGVVIGEHVTVPSRPGGNVVTTLDIGLQATAEAALRSTIRYINQGREEDEYVTAGSVVAIDVNNGQILATASVPGFSLETFSADFPDLLEDPDRPMMNRATGGIYEPGSAFKMVTAFAALYQGVITEHTAVFCDGAFHEFADIGYRPRCMGIHGYITMRDAIAHSCNVYFFQLARWLGWSQTSLDRMDVAAQQFGLGELTGIGFGEVPGHRSTWDAMLEFNRRWGSPYDTVFDGQIIQVAIGQGISQFTPLQMANYTAMIATGGLRFRPTLLREVRNYDNSAVIYVNEPEVMIDLREEFGHYFIPIQEGMLLTSTHGTADRHLANFRIPVASKTGTVELGEDQTGPRSHGVFVAYAPADNPQIAIAVVIEHGGSGSAVIPVAVEMFDYFFRIDVVDQRRPLENVMLR